MSSRSLAAARAKRANIENAPPVSGNRPGTSIGSHAAFVPQGYQSQIPQPSSNIRLPRGYSQPQQQFQQQQQQQQQQQNNAYQQVKQSQQSLPFSKLSISDAIGLITLRLGRVEQWVIETEHENETKPETSSDNLNLPQNSKIVDNSVFSSIINRLEIVEKRDINSNNNNDNQVLTKLCIELTEDVNKLKDQLKKNTDESIKQNLLIIKHTEQLFKFERELIETKDILKTFMIKYDLFVTETSNKFTDYEFALSELEKNIQTNEITNYDEDAIFTDIQNNEINETNETTEINETNNSDIGSTLLINDSKETSHFSMKSLDLKNDVNI